MLKHFVAVPRKFVSCLLILTLTLLTNIHWGAAPSIVQNSKLYEHTEWSRNLSIYEVNIRQYTHEGTFKAFALNLPKLKELEVGILWFMPIHPIGEINRKGPLGSYYSIKDYTAVNPEFGTHEDFKDLVKQAHDLGMYVIIDWVANHTSWDNVWTKTNPNFFTKDATGKYVSPYDWTDVIELNYDNKELWEHMRDAMKFWIDELNIDGFRCDVAAMVPLDFWKWVRPQLEKNKKIFMLAEAHEPELHEAFDMTYNWQLKDLFVECAKGNKTAADFFNYFEMEKKNYPADAYRMTFTSNHDENTWHGTDQERFGLAAEVFAVVSTIVPGMPLVYSGQEAGLDKRLKFFERDPIDWKEDKMHSVYKKLFLLKKQNRALWNGSAGGELKKLFINDKNIFAFSREKEGNKVIAFFNLSNEKKRLNFSDKVLIGTYKNLFGGQTVKIDSNYELIIEPYGYQILVDPLTEN